MSHYAVLRSTTVLLKFRLRGNLKLAKTNAGMYLWD